MKNKTPNIRPELSALGRRKDGCPLLLDLIQAVIDFRQKNGFGTARYVVDLGCGQLRNLSELRKRFQSLLLVDTEFQLNRTHNFGGRSMTIPEYIKRYYPDGSIAVMSDHDFSASQFRSDVIFSINVMDVVPPRTRHLILNAITKHLSPTGQFASLVARNDSRTLHLCNEARKYQDGHIFHNHGAFTFYKNWAGTQLAELYRSHSLHVVRDLSRYRHSCLVCIQKSESKRRWMGRPMQRQDEMAGRIARV
jgi:hypothetical protein